MVVVVETMRRPHHADEVGRQDVGALVQGLEKTVLGIGARPAPQHRHRVHRHRAAVGAHRLAQAFHHQLLQETRQQRQALVVGHHRVAGGSERIAVPDREQAMPGRQVARRRCFAHVLVHHRRAFEQARETVVADGQLQCETDRRPQRITPADPVPHRQHPVGRDAEGFGARDVGADRVQAISAAQPVAQDAAVEQRFLGAETLGHQDAGRARRVEAGQQVARGAAVDVGEEVHAEAAILEIAQCVHGQARPEVAATDAHADDVGDRALGQPGVQLVHALTGFPGLGGGGAGGFTAANVAAQRAVQRRAAFGGVDDFAVEQGRQRRTEPGRARQRLQLRPGGVIDALAREAGVDRTHPQRPGAGPRRLRGHQFGQRLGGQAFAVLLQGLPVSVGQHACFQKVA